MILLVALVVIFAAPHVTLARTTVETQQTADPSFWAPVMAGFVLPGTLAVPSGIATGIADLVQDPEQVRLAPTVLIC